MPQGLPPMSAGVFGYLGYDMVRQMERLPPAKPDPIGVPEALLVRPTVMVVFDTVARRDGGGDAGSPAPPASRARAACEARRRGSTPWSRRSKAPLDHKPPAVIRRCSPRQAVSNTSEAEYQAMVAQGEGIHRRRRRVPGRAVAALHRPLRTAAVLALPRAAADQPLALPVLPRFRRLPVVVSSPEILVRVRDGKVVHPADRRHAPARRRRSEEEALEPNCSPTRRSAPSI